MHFSVAVLGTRDGEDGQTRMTTGPQGRLPRLRNGSLADRARSALLDAILTGRFPNNKLPPEPVLAAELGVSRTTIRTALSSLERFGVIARTPGRGTAVRPHVGRRALILQRLVGFRSLLEEQYHEVVVSQTSWVAQDPSPRAREVLAAHEGDPVLRSSKILYADGKPAISIIDEVPLRNCGLDREEAVRTSTNLEPPDSIFEFSKTWPVGEIGHTLIELVPAVSPGPDESGLRLPEGTPLIRLLETHYDQANRPVALSTVDIADEMVRFHVVRQG